MLFLRLELNDVSECFNHIEFTSGVEGITREGISMGRKRIAYDIVMDPDLIGLKTDLGSKFDGAGKLAKDEIDMVKNELTKLIKIDQFFASFQDHVPKSSFTGCRKV